MTPEEKFNQEVWFVLNKIKQRSFYSSKDGIIKYSIKSPPDLKAEGMPFPVEEMEIVDKLQDWEAIKIIPLDDIAEISNSETALSKGQNVCIVIKYLKILQPKFNELYHLYYQKIKEIKEDLEKRHERINKEVMGQLREQAERQEEKEDWKKEVIEEIKKSEVKTSDKWLIFHTKDDVGLKFNKENGNVKFGKTEGNLAPDTGEYKVFLYLLEASSHMAKYDDLMKLMTGKPLIERLALDSTIRNIKRELKILPKGKSLNKDIFITRKSWKGYSLDLID